MAKESNRRGVRVVRRREKNDINSIKRESVMGSLAVRLFYLLLLFFCLVLLTGRHVLAVQTHCSVEDEGFRPVLRMATQGGLSETEGFQNSAEIDELARFAVEEHNDKENALLELSRVVNAKEQVVAGKLHHLTLEVVEAGKKMLYEAKVWVKPWMNFKELQEFKNAGESPATFTACDLGAKRGGHEPGWRDVPTHDPVVQDAAKHAVKAIQERSNSLLPYELLDILHSKAEVIEEIARFDLLLKLKRGNKEEKFKVEVHKNLEGNFLLNQMQMHHSD